MREVLFGRVTSLLESEPAGVPLLLDGLLPHISAGRLTAPPPLVMQRLVTHLEQQGRLQVGRQGQQGRLQTLEECLVRVDIPSLDINQVLPMCWRRGLYDVIVRIHTVGMGDYVSPLLEMLSRLSALLADGAPLMDGQAQLGNKLLVYISSCLAGRGYPSGQIPSERVHEVKLAVLSALTAVHSKNAADTERPYPHLRTLLTFDTREFLNVLSLSFEEDVFCSELGMRHRQRIVDILLTLMVDKEEYSASQVGSLFTFIARQMALPNSTVSVSRDLFDKVVDHLTVPGDTAHHEERQQALAELISTGVLQHYDTERLAQLAEAAKFYRICELLFEGRGEFDRAAGCMLRHGSGRSSVHRFVAERAAAERTAPVAPPRDAASIALCYLQDLLDIDLDRTAALFTSCLSRHLEEAVQRLDSSPEQRYRFLGAILQQSSSMVLPGSVYGQYLTLMCQLEPDRVTQFISEQDTFDDDNYLKICRSAGHREGEAHLLERSGDTAAALQTLIDGLSDAERTSVPAARLVSRLSAAIRLCQRSAGRLPDEHRRRGWFTLLERAVAFQQSDLDAALVKGLVPMVVGSMIGHVPLPEVMRRLLKEPAYSGGQLGQLRPLLADLLRTCEYERVLYDSARRITQADTWHGHVQKRHVQSRGYGAPGRCHVCGRRPDLQAGQMLAFRCGHFCHTACAPQTESGQERRCALCHGRDAQRPGRGPESTEDSGQRSGDSGGGGREPAAPAVVRAGPTAITGPSLTDLVLAGR
ncbi:Vacuolar protein sorting-associated protein 8 [Amphibalanus amphitrite]|uniref:Vacuolar protein sorting-associated protein 8 n=1 Tax=Amphibalanus amphitrite TaxID=1232801 RepID=A0A6A4WIJ3_AMPAM|nr:Vacuolar protein sorting-associated protein 8 [Amphibalanus amphitrite]